MGFLGFGKKKEEKTLEKMAEDAAVKLGVRIDASFNNPGYYPFNVIGTGDSETDSKRALERFKHNLVYGVNGLPEVISLIKEDFTYTMGTQKKHVKRIYAVGHKPNSHPPAA